MLITSDGDLVERMPTASPPLYTYHCRKIAWTIFDPDKCLWKPMEYIYLKSSTSSKPYELVSWLASETRHGLEWTARSGLYLEHALDLVSVVVRNEKIESIWTDNVSQNLRLFTKIGLQGHFVSEEEELESLPIYRKAGGAPFSSLGALGIANAEKAKPCNARLEDYSIALASFFVRPVLHQ